METEDRIDDFNGPYRFLSNFHSASVRYDGIVFPTAEHAFQAQKAVRPEDLRLILGAPTPSEAKRLGHTVQIRND